MIREVQPERLILAHMGGFRRWDEVEEYLVGEDVWFDTAVVFGVIRMSSSCGSCAATGQRGSSLAQIRRGPGRRSSWNI